MNTNELLTEIRELNCWLAQTPTDHQLYAHKLEKLSACVIKLDEMLSKGATLPEAWLAMPCQNCGQRDPKATYSICSRCGEK